MKNKIPKPESAISYPKEFNEQYSDATDVKIVYVLKTHFDEQVKINTRLRKELEILRTDKERQRLTIGEYTIRIYETGDYWIEHHSGEGMGVHREEFEKYIDDFYKANF